jgi:hypothetical protein
MKYLYSILIIAIGFFAIPFIFDVSGNALEHMRLIGKEGDDSTPVKYERRSHYNETEAVQTVVMPKPTAVRIIKE